MGNIIEWEQDTLKNFTHDDYLVKHNLHEHPIFSDEGLIKILDAYPRDKLEVFTMGKDPHGWGQWCLGRHNNLSGAELMEAVKNGRIWLNLRGTNKAAPEVNEVCEALFNEIEQKTGVNTFKHDMGMLISSPNAQVYYHADMPLVLLVQIRGTKKVYLYPPEDPYLTDEQMESIAIKEKDEQLRPKPEWDNDCLLIHDLKPGELLTWRQNAPHRIENHDCVNVSFSTEFLTTEVLIRANTLYANGCLRRYFGMKPSFKNSPSFVNYLKVIYARIVKLMGGYKGKNTLPVPHFTLDKENLGKLNFDKDYDASVLN